MEARFLFLLFLGCVSFCSVASKTKKTNYNETLAVMMAHLSAAAYQGHSEKMDCVGMTFPHSQHRKLVLEVEERCVLGTSSSSSSISSVCSVYTVTSEDVDEVIVVFRGLNEQFPPFQLYKEAMVITAGGEDFYGMGHVNSYYKNAVDLLWERTAAFLNDPIQKGKRVIFTGHSLGGAMAALAAARAVQQGVRTADQVSVYTFGQPRTGSFTFAKSYDALKIETYRVVYIVDTIPRTPECEKNYELPENRDGVFPCLASQVDGHYYHHGTEIWYPDEDMARGAPYIECLGSPLNEDFACSASQRSTPFHISEFISTHTNYFAVSFKTFGESGCRDRTQTPIGDPSTIRRYWVDGTLFPLTDDFDK